MMEIRAALMKKFDKTEDFSNLTLINTKVLLGLSHAIPDDSLINYYISIISDEHQTPSTVPKKTAASTNPTTSSSPSSPLPQSNIHQNQQSQQNQQFGLPSSFNISTNEGELVGDLRKDLQGHHWLLSNSQFHQFQPIYIPPSQLNGSSDGDLVVATLDERKDGKRSGKIIRKVDLSSPSTGFSSAPDHKNGKQSLGTSNISSSHMLSHSSMEAAEKAGIVHGTFRIDSRGNGWVMNSTPQIHGIRAIFIPKQLWNGYKDMDPIVAQTYTKYGKYVAKPIKSSSSYFEETSVVKQHHNQQNFRIQPESDSKGSRLELDPMAFLNDSPLALELLNSVNYELNPSSLEMTGIFKVEDQNVGLVIDELEPSNPPVAILAELKRNAVHGDRVLVNIFGKSNSNFDRVVPLGEIVAILPQKSTKLSDFNLFKNDSSLSDSGTSYEHAKNPSLCMESNQNQQRSSSPHTTPSKLEQTLSSTSPLAASGSPDAMKKQKKSIRRNIELIPETSGDFVGVLKENENGGAWVAHPTLRWTYVLIPAEALGNCIMGDQVAIEIIPGQSSQGRLDGRIVGIVKPKESEFESYETRSDIEIDEDDTHEDDNSNSVHSNLSSNDHSFIEEAQKRLERYSQELGNSQSDSTERSFFNPSAPPLSESSEYISPNSSILLSSKSSSVPAPSQSNAIEHAFPTPQSIRPNEIIIIDFGSGYIKAGDASQNVATKVIPSITGTMQHSFNKQMVTPLLPSNSSSLLGKANQPTSSNTSLKPGDILVGHSALGMKSVLTLNRPMISGFVSDWSLISKLLQDILPTTNNFSSQSTNNSSALIKSTTFRKKPIVVIMESGGNPDKNREEFARILFEEFEVPFLFCARSASCILQCERRTTGIVVDVGHTTTTITPINKGSILHYGITSLDVSGSDVTLRLIQLLHEDGFRFFQSTSQQEAAATVKEQIAFVDEDPPQLRKNRKKTRLPTKYSMTDGTIITLEDHPWQCSEILFEPSEIGKDVGGIHKQIESCINMCPPELKTELLSNIVLAGGTTLMRGFKIRLQKELQLIYPNDEIVIFTSSTAQMSAWMGAALLTHLPDFKDCLLSKEEFMATGPISISNTFV